MKNLFGDLALDASVQEVKAAIEAQTPLDISTLATKAKQLPDNHQVTISNISSVPLVNVSALATSAKQLADNHNVKVTTMPTVSVTGTFWPVTQPVSGTVAVTNDALNSINGKLPIQGQAAPSNSMPVVLPASQISTLTPPAAITGYATAAKQLADGHGVNVDNIADTPLVDVSALATEATLGAVSGSLQSQLSVGVYDNNNAKVDPATSSKQLPDGHNVAISDLNPTAANQLNNVLNERAHCTYTWTDGVLTEKIAEYANRTETTTYTWTNGNLTDKITITT